MLFFYEKIKQKVYNEHDIMRPRRGRLPKLHTSKLHTSKLHASKLYTLKPHTSKEPYCSVLPSIADTGAADTSTADTSTADTSAPIKIRFNSDVGLNALIQLCGYPSSTQNIDDMIANKYFI